PDLSRGRINRDDEWILQHVQDPEMIAPGLRTPPGDALKIVEARAVVAYAGKVRAAAPPPKISAEDRLASDVLGTKCIACHTIDGDGGHEGPDLSHAAKKPDRTAAWFKRWITDPGLVNPDADMPAFGGTLTDAQPTA